MDERTHKRAVEIVDRLISEYQEGPRNLSHLVRFKVSGEHTPRPPPPPPPDDGDPGGPWSGGNDGIRGVQWRETSDGDLEFTLTDPDLQEEVREKLAKREPYDIADVLEPATSNGLSWLDPYQIGAMTEAPILTDGSFDDQGGFMREKGTKIWWYSGYQVRSPLQDLAEKGRTVFQRVKGAL